MMNFPTIRLQDSSCSFFLQSLANFVLIGKNRVSSFYPSPFPLLENLKVAYFKITVMKYLYCLFSHLVN